MSELGHDLRNVFAGDVEILHRLKAERADFRTLADRYHDLTREIVRVEDGLEAASDERLEDLKKQRLQLLDQVGAMIAGQKAA
jgi:uncharacterized protein YdcH (DUF465 family)